MANLLMYREGISKAGNPWGVVTIEDYSGSHEIPLFGEAYPAYRGYCKEGMYLYITAKYQPKRSSLPVDSSTLVNHLSVFPEKSSTSVDEHSRFFRALIQLIRTELQPSGVVIVPLRRHFPFSEVSICAHRSEFHILGSIIFFCRSDFLKLFYPIVAV